VVGDKKVLKRQWYFKHLWLCDKELAVRGKNPTETGENQNETKIFLCLLQTYIICPGLVTEREFATEIQKIEAQVLCTVKILPRTFTCEISVMHRTFAGPFN